jgi:hypothetical protein
MDLRVGFFINLFMKYLQINADDRGTGLRDLMLDEYIEIDSLNISTMLSLRFKIWLNHYQSCYPYHEKDREYLQFLDDEGKEICHQFMEELIPAKIEYCSDFEVRVYVLTGGKWYCKS